MKLFGVRITFLRVFVTAVVVAIVMAVPALRRAVWFILPLGSGYDDIIEIIALAAIGITLFVEVWRQRYPNNPYNRKY